jgi:HD-GYP domain-containing protein (c-di-GMP phosphodiesterase class II)
MLQLSDLWEIELAALLSRIGHIVLPRDLIAKARGGDVLDENTKQALLRAPEVGHELLSRIPRLESVAHIILYKNKCFDGSGFPEDPVAGPDIPVGARILKVLNDLSELRLQGFSKPDACAIMQSRTGSYDSRVLDAAMALYARSDGTARIERSTAAETRISALQMGDILLSNVETLDDRLLIKAGEVVTEPLLVRLSVYAKLVGIREPVKVRRTES